VHMHTDSRHMIAVDFQERIQLASPGSGKEKEGNSQEAQRQQPSSQHQVI
jgi:hypothetical protein